jgi:hypothetical protein
MILACGISAAQAAQTSATLHTRPMAGSWRMINATAPTQ